MSSLWTPGGEHHVPRDSGPPGGGAAGGPGGGRRPPGSGEPTAGAPEAAEAAEAELTAEQQEALEEAAAEIARIRDQLAAAPAEVVVANHVMGLYELAAVHLNREEPDLASARLAIDALGAVLDACAGRLGEPEPTLRDARSQLQLAFVQVSNWARARGGEAPEPGSNG